MPHRPVTKFIYARARMSVCGTVWDELAGKSSAYRDQHGTEGRKLGKHIVDLVVGVRPVEGQAQISTRKRCEPLQHAT